MSRQESFCCAAWRHAFSLSTNSQGFWLPQSALNFYSILFTYHPQFSLARCFVHFQFIMAAVVYQMKEKNISLFSTLQKRKWFLVLKLWQNQKWAMLCRLHLILIIPLVNLNLVLQQCLGTEIWFLFRIIDTYCKISFTFI